MTRTATGGLPTGLLLALVQLPVTWLAIGLYEYTARRASTRSRPLPQTGRLDARPAAPTGGRRQRRP